MKSRLTLILAMVFSMSLSAKSLGVVGETFPVAEISFLQLIEARLTELTKNGIIDTLNQQWRDTVARHADRPKPLNLARAKHTTTHYYKPEIVLTQAITDNQQHVLFPAGIRMNALKKLPHYAPCWLFFNADDEAQLHWAQRGSRLCANPKVILTGGSVSAAENELKTTIYFDQGGRLAQKLQLHTVPARVVREGNTLKIEELAIRENGDVL